MTDFQFGLAAIGAGVILAVLGYNRWTTRRSEPRRSHPPEPADPAPSESSAASRVEPVLEGYASGQPSQPADRLASLLERKPVLDSLIDVQVVLTLDHVVAGEAVLAAMPRSRRIGSKTFSVEGLNAATEAWELPRAGQRYASLQAGVQLANRSGALNEIEFSEFASKVQVIADAVAAAVDLPDMMAEVARARELDQFASDHDAQLVFKVTAARAAWSPGYISQCAAQLGFIAGPLPGRLVLPGAEPGAAPVLVLQYETRAALADDPEQNAVLEFHLLLDVPQVARAEKPYQRLLNVASRLAQAMEGMVTDERGVPLGEETLASIGEDLEMLYDQLERRDLPAGSLLARRLFS